MQGEVQASMVLIPRSTNPIQAVKRREAKKREDEAMEKGSSR
jgi:hypothetical protein